MHAVSGFYFWGEQFPDVNGTLGDDDDDYCEVDQIWRRSSLIVITTFVLKTSWASYILLIYLFQFIL